MSARDGQTWKLSNMDGQGYVIFTVLRSERHGVTEVEHEILVLKGHHFGVFEADEGRASVWWESQEMPWEIDPVYTRIA